MARSVKDTKLDTRAARDKLKTGDAIHWRMLVPGELHLGYRRRVPGNPGVWIARRFIGKSPECTSGYNKTTLGRADDYQDADGRSVLSYADAQKLAHKKADAPEETSATAIPTVAEAMQDYISYLRTHKKTARGAEQVLRVHISPVLAGTRIDRLTLKQLEQWRDGLVSKPAQLRTRLGDKQHYKPAPTTETEKRARKATANRIQTSLKASLNLARRHHPGMSDNAWRQLKPFGKVDAARPGHLSVSEAQRLINAADAASGFRSLVEAALLTGCRYGELCRLKVADYSQGRVTIHETKSGKPRTVRLTEEGAAFFAALCVGRSGDQVMFLRSDGEPFGPSHQARPMLAACKAANIAPAVGFHQLRHTWASLSVMAGMPLMLVAETLGHTGGTVMVEKHYGHLTDDYRDQKIREHAPRFGISPANGNVIPLVKEAI